MIQSVSEETIFKFYLTAIIRIQIKLLVSSTLEDNEAYHKEKILTQWLSPPKIAEEKEVIVEEVNV